MQLPNALGVRCALRTGQKDCKLSEVIWHGGSSRRKEVIGRQFGFVKGSMVGSESPDGR